MKIFRFLKFFGSWLLRRSERYKTEKNSARFLLLLWILLFLLLLLYARYAAIIHVDGQVLGGQDRVASRLLKSVSFSTSTPVSTSILISTPTPILTLTAALTSKPSYKTYINTVAPTTIIIGSSTYIRDTSSLYQPGFGGGGGNIGSGAGGDVGDVGDGSGKVDIIKSAKDLGIPICK